ncbi:secreted RxLR effector peptide protein, putative [Phytophthora infestans T30-4]|uniref:RxLR effector protein CRE9 n=2 Tax=Phytophthora infestans TaxID=4787 RepID=CRE9_PHYIT
MRTSVFVALVVATFVATCISFTSAKNVAQIRDVDGGNNVQETRTLAEADDWWLASTNTEERSGGAGFFSKLRGKVHAKQSSGVMTTQKLNDQQVKTITKEVATTVKKDRRTWPMIKKGLKILYGALLAGLIIVGVEAMLS